jgi:hypothetical protein
MKFVLSVCATVALVDLVMQITLTPDLESILGEEARRRNTTPELVILDCLRQQFLAPKQNRNGSQPEEQLPQLPDTDQSLTAADMAAALDRVGTPASAEETDSQFDPDTYPLF